MKINFHVYDSRNYAIRVFVGGVNGVSGEPIKANMATILKRLNGIERTQDYLYVRGEPKNWRGLNRGQEWNPGQQWLDGVAIAPGVVRQFIAVPYQSPESIEYQVTGSGGVGGLQLEIIPQYELGRFAIHLADTTYMARRPMLLESPTELGIPPQTRIYATELDGLSRERTLLDELDLMDSATESTRTVELLLWPPSSASSFQVIVECQYPRGRGSREEKVSLKAFPETTLDFIKEQAAHAFRLPSNRWAIFLSAKRYSGQWDFNATCRRRHSIVSQNLTLREVGVRDGQKLILGKLALVGASTYRSDYSPLMDVGAGGKIRQHIVPDEEDARSWNVERACLINVQILDANSFASITGFAAPPSPISFNTYIERGMPFCPAGLLSETVANLAFGLGHIQPVRNTIALPEAPADQVATRSPKTLPGYCDSCRENWASYR